MILGHTSPVREATAQFCTTGTAAPEGQAHDQRQQLAQEDVTVFLGTFVGQEERGFSEDLLASDEPPSAFYPGSRDNPPRRRISAVDFVADCLAAARRFRILVVLEDFTRECLGGPSPACRSPGSGFVRHLDALLARRG